MHNDYVNSRNLIINILKEYELGDAYLVLQGLDLIGFENMNFWLQVVDYVNKYKGNESLVFYINAMQLIGSRILLFYMNEINNNTLDFNERYEKYIHLLTETKKNLELFESKIKK